MSAQRLAELARPPRSAFETRFASVGSNSSGRGPRFVASGEVAVSRFAIRNKDNALLLFSETEPSALLAHREILHGRALRPSSTLQKPRSAIRSVGRFDCTTFHGDRSGIIHRA